MVLDKYPLSVQDEAKRAIKRTLARAYQGYHQDLESCSLQGLAELAVIGVSPLMRNVHANVKRLKGNSD